MLVWGASDAAPTHPSPVTSSCGAVNVISRARSAYDARSVARAGGDKPPANASKLVTGRPADRRPTISSVASGVMPGSAPRTDADAEAAFTEPGPSTVRIDAQE